MIGFVQKSTKARALLVLVGLVAVAMFFSYRLLEVPTGLTSDEGAFGYNAVLLARTTRDQNGSFLPFFVLSINGKDWRQPVTQYYLALFFKLFGASVFNLRFSSVAVVVVSAVLLFILANKLLGGWGAVLAVLAFLTTPLVMIQAHMGLDNIMPVPFGILWLLGVCLFTKTDKKKFLVLAGVSLGVGFYTYKGMRGTVPVWAALTVLYLALRSHVRSKFLTGKFLTNMAVFSLTISPFLAIIPFLERRYPCAVFDCQRMSIGSVYEFLYPYLSSFDLGFLFIKGDLTAFHSTGWHGMLLLATLPVFLVGVYQAIKKKGFWLLTLAAFLTAPLLFGLVGSVHRASRLMIMTPPYSLLVGLGGVWLWGLRREVWGKAALGLTGILIFLNYFDFARYYWFTYPRLTESLFGRLESYKAYERLAKEVRVRGLVPYIALDLYEGGQESSHFFEAIYFPRRILKVLPGETPPPGSILLTHQQDIPGTKRVETGVRDYNLLVRD